MELNVAQIIERTEAEGPGVRFALWVQGCPMRCKGCCNPEFLRFESKLSMDPDALAERAIEAGVEGVSLLGGEPFTQAEGLSRFCLLVRRAGLSVMVYTGYTLSELREKRDEHVEALLSRCDLLVDGRYEQSLRTTDRRWIGSSNQSLHFLSDRYSPSDPRFSSPNTVEIRLGPEGITINGWPLHGAKKLLNTIQL